MSNILIAVETLTGSDKALAEVIAGHEAVAWGALDSASREAYAWHLLFLDEAARRSLGLSHLSIEEVFYNSYFWVLIFSKRYESKFGWDAGIEQQAFKVLEAAPSSVDWEVVEEIEQTVQQQA
jgi:hypothetical protein